MKGDYSIERYKCVSFNFKYLTDTQGSEAYLNPNLRPVNYRLHHPHYGFFVEVGCLLLGLYTKLPCINHTFEWVIRCGTLQNFATFDPVVTNGPERTFVQVAANDRNEPRLTVFCKAANGRFAGLALRNH